MFKEYSQYDAMGLVKLINDGQISPKEALLAAIERADRLNSALNAIIHRFDEKALAACDTLPKRGVFLACHFC